jgi:gluconolactonase
VIGERARKYLRAAVVAALALAGVVSAQPGVAAEIVASGLQFPEGTIFVGNVLYFVDYSSSDVLRVVNRKVELVWHQDGCNANGLVEQDGELLVACYGSGTIVRMTTAGKIKQTIQHDDAGGVFVNPNDLAADAIGGVYFTASGDNASPGKVHYRDAAGHVAAVADNIDYANGVAVSHDGKRLYVGESRKQRLLGFDIGADGKLSNRTDLVNLQDMLADRRKFKFTPDGIRLDQHGRLFVALYDGGGFAVIGSDGKLIKMVDLPAAHHSNLAISPDGKSVVVTAIEDSPDGSYRGALMKIDNPVFEAPPSK